MDTLHQDPVLAQAYGANARKRYDTLFTGQIMGREYANVYGQLLGEALDENLQNWKTIPGEI